MSPFTQTIRFFTFFRIKFNFNRIKSATKFLCVKTSSGKVVEQSISYEITENYRTKSASFHLKYWLKLTYPVVAFPQNLGLKAPTPNRKDARFAFHTRRAVQSAVADLLVIIR